MTQGAPEMAPLVLLQAPAKMFHRKQFQLPSKYLIHNLIRIEYGPLDIYLKRMPGLKYQQE